MTKKKEQKEEGMFSNEYMEWHYTIKRGRLCRQ